MAETSDILARLLERTNQEKVNWQSTSADDVFIAVLGNSSVRITEFFHDGMHAVLSILNEEGREIENLHNVSDDEWYEDLRELYQKARRIALGVDSQLDDLLKILESDP